MSDIFHLCDSGVISGASFWLWITQTSLNICTRVWLFFINSYVCAYSSSPCVWIVIHQSTWHVNHHASVYVIHPHIDISIMFHYKQFKCQRVTLLITNKSSHNKSSLSVSCLCLFCLSASTLLIIKNVLFSEVWFICFFRGDLHPRYCRGLSRGRRSVLLHCLQSLWLC